MPSMLFEEYVPFEITPVEDSYEEVEIQMPIPRDRNQIPAIHAIEVYPTGLGNLGVGNTAESLRWQLSKRSKTAMSDLGDSDILFIESIEYQPCAAPVALWVHKLYDRKELRYPIASPHIKLFFGAFCDAGTAIAKITGRVCYTMRYVSRADIMEALMD